MTYWGTAGSSFKLGDSQVTDVFLAAGGRYAAIAALTNIPATLFAICLYEIFFVDSDRGLFHLLFDLPCVEKLSCKVIPKAHLEYARVVTNHKRLGDEHGDGQLDTPLESGKQTSFEQYRHARV